MTTSRVLIVAALLWVAISTSGTEGRAAPRGKPAAKTAQNRAPTLTGSWVIRDSFHLQVSVGFGGGPSNVGLFHAMEVGGTFKNGITLALLHTFIYNKGILGQRGGPNQFGGFLPEIKIPLYYHDLVLKLAVGPGGIRRASDNKPIWSVAWYYGIDFHIPFYRRSGMTVGAQVIQTYVRGRHYFGASLSLGYTFF